MRHLLASLAIAALVAGPAYERRAPPTARLTTSPRRSTPPARKLRAFNSNMMAALNPKLKQLQVRRGWSDEELASHTQALLSDQQVDGLRHPGLRAVQPHR